MESVILGACSSCARKVPHDERGAEFFYDERKPTELLRVVCSGCADQAYGTNIPPGWTKKRFASFLMQTGIANGAPDDLVGKAGTGAYLSSAEMVVLLGITDKDQRTLVTLTTPEERLRRYRESGQNRAGGGRKA